MNITKEQVKNDIAGVDAQLAELVASVNKLTGAKSVLVNLLAYMEQPEPDTTAISNDNAEIQSRDQAADEAIANAEPMPLQDFAKLIAGEGAVANEPEANDETGFRRI